MGLTRRSDTHESYLADYRDVQMRSLPAISVEKLELKGHILAHRVLCSFATMLVVISSNLVAICLINRAFVLLHGGVQFSRTYSCTVIHTSFTPGKFAI